MAEKGNQKLDREYFEKFSWLNQINLLLYEHELGIMHKKYRTDLATLMQPGETKRLRNSLDAYSNWLSALTFTTDILDKALLDYQQIAKMEINPFDKRSSARRCFSSLEKNNYNVNNDSMRVASETPDPLRAFLAWLLPDWITYTKAQKTLLFLAKSILLYRRF